MQNPLPVPLDLKKHLCSSPWKLCRLWGLLILWMVGCANEPTTSKPEQDPINQADTQITAPEILGGSGIWTGLHPSPDLVDSMPYSGLLLGFSTGKEVKYHWYVRNSDSIRRRATGNYLPVNTDSGWIYLNIHYLESEGDSCEGAEAEAMMRPGFLKASRIGFSSTKGKAKTAANKKVYDEALDPEAMECGKGKTDLQEILYIGKGGYATLHREEEFGKPNEAIFTYSLQSWHRNNSIRPSDYFPKSVLQVAKESVGKELGLQLTGEPVPLADRQVNLIFQRRRGEVRPVLVAAVNGGVGPVIGTTDLGESPEELVRAYPMPLDFDHLSQTYPGLEDVFISPEEETVWLLQQGILMAVDVLSGEEIYRDQVSGNVVMVEWATQKQVADWEKQLAQ